MQELEASPAHAPSEGGNGQSAHAESALDQMTPGLDAGARQQLIESPAETSVAEVVDRRLLPRFVEPEALWKRWLFLAVAIALAGAYFGFTSSFWAPGHAGNNQNGYLVGAKNLANSARSMGFEPKTPYSFVGWMWVMADADSSAPGGGMHYPKYPLGVPLLDAIVYRIGNATGGEARAVQWVYRVSPICMSLALLGTFLVTRALAGSFAGLIAMILLGTNPLILLFTNNPNSHAASICFLAFGVWMLLRWWESGSVWRGLLAGFLLGYALTIRYTEGLMLAPLAAAVLLMIHYRPAWQIAWWQVAVWAIAAVSAFALGNSVGGGKWQWQNDLNGKLGGRVAWWIQAAAVMLPLLATIRWSRIRDTLVRDALFSGEWLRRLLCVVLVLAAINAPLPRLAQTTPTFIYILRYSALVAALVGAVVLIHSIQWKRLRSWLTAVSPAIGWLLPVVTLLLYNRITMGTWTGYDTTNESSGFTWNEFQRKWRFAVDQLYDTGLYALLPLGIAGLALAFRWNWRAALVLSLWFLPGTLLYMSYYYGMGMPMIGYLRFFASMIPPAVIATAWLLQRASQGVPVAAAAHASGNLAPPRRWAGSIAAPIAIGAFVSLASAANLAGTLGALERDFVIATNLSDVGQRVREAVPSNPKDPANLSMVFGNSQRLLNYLQFVLTCDFYGADYFRNGFPVPSMGSNDPNQPNPIQPARKNFLNKAYHGLENADMVRVQNQLMSDALSAGRRVFVVLESSQMSSFKRIFLSSKEFQTTTIRRWTEPARMSTSAIKSIANLGGDGAGRSVPQNWQIIEVELAPPAAESPAPSTAPATTLPSNNPATAPG